MSEEKTSSERTWRVLELMLDQSEKYHNHKETMAHAGVALQFALVAAILSVSTWPPAWVPGVHLSPRFLSVSGFVTVWFLIHVFVRWQLRFRRWAAIWNAALVRTLRKWASALPDSEELASWEPKHSQKASAFLIFLDYLVPCYSASLPADIDKRGWPVGLVREWTEQERTGTRAVRAEWLLWAGSMLMAAIGLLRVLS